MENSNLSVEARGHEPLTQRRAAGALLTAGPIIFLLTELITAAAWKDPPYSYTYHFISNLGVDKPSELFGQYMYSPLAYVMNTGFFLFGITIFAGVIALRGLSGWRRWAVIAPASLLAVAGILLALFPGSSEAFENGSGGFHAIGAFAGFTGANILAVILGRMRRRIGFSLRIGIGLVTVGVIGLLSAALYITVIFSSAYTIIGFTGLIERGATHPFLIGILCAGVSIGQNKLQTGTS